MPLRSMTGYGRAAATAGRFGWTVEIKAVNGRGLELRCRLPGLFDPFEAGCRDLVAQRVARGNVNLAINLAEAGQDEPVTVNSAALDRYAVAALDIARRHGLAPPSAGELMGLRGVIQSAGEAMAEAERIAVEAALLASVKAALDSFDQARAQEGAALARALAEAIDGIETLAAMAETLAAGQSQALAVKLGERLAALLGDQSLDPQRLAQEVALLATRADVREELDRLSAHIAAARGLLDKNEPVGRAFEFLSQELVREVNTLCSKSSDIALTRVGLDLKAVIEQLREQIRNIE